MKTNSSVREIDVFSNYSGLFDLHIALAIDDDFVKPASIAISSVIFNNPDKKLCFHIFTTEINESNLGKIKEINIGTSAIKIHIFSDDFFSNYQTKDSLPKSMYYRLMIPYILNSNISKVLYMDADIVCTSPIDELIRLDLGSYKIAACVDGYVAENEKYYLENIGVINPSNYFNSGVMLINVEQWNEFNVLDKFNALILKRNYTYPDQDVLNIILQNEVLFLDGKFNTFSTHNGKYKNDLKYDYIVFLHFAGPLKP